MKIMEMNENIETINIHISYVCNHDNVVAVVDDDADDDNGDDESLR